MATFTPIPQGGAQGALYVTKNTSGTETIPPGTNTVFIGQTLIGNLTLTLPASKLYAAGSSIKIKDAVGAASGFLVALLPNLALSNLLSGGIVAVTALTGAGDTEVFADGNLSWSLGVLPLAQLDTAHGAHFTDTTGGPFPVTQFNLRQNAGFTNNASFLFESSPVGNGGQFGFVSNIRSGTKTSSGYGGFVVGGLFQATSGTTNNYSNAPSDQGNAYLYGINAVVGSEPGHTGSGHGIEVDVNQDSWAVPTRTFVTSTSNPRNTSGINVVSGGLYQPSAAYQAQSTGALFLRGMQMDTSAYDIRGIELGTYDRGCTPNIPSEIGITVSSGRSGILLQHHDQGGADPAINIVDQNAGHYLGQWGADGRLLAAPLLESQPIATNAGSIRATGGGSRAVDTGVTAAYGFIASRDANSLSTGYPLVLQPQVGALQVGPGVYNQTTDPHVKGQLWNNAGVMTISNG